MHYISEEDFKELHHLKERTIHWNYPRSGNAPYPCVPCPNISLGIHPMAFIDLTKLRTLDLAGNSLTELNDFWFENLQDLTKLLLSFNLLQSAFQGELTCFSSLSKLQHLDLSFNYGHNTYPQTVKLSNSFSKLRSLQVLHLVCLVFREIVFDTLKPLVSLKNLTELYLGTNFIHSNSTRTPTVESNIPIREQTVSCFN
jgi:Leucine-rich repeat (LRR) protein